MRSWSGLVVLLAVYSAFRLSGNCSMNAFSLSIRYCFTNSLNRSVTSYLLSGLGGVASDSLGVMLTDSF